MKVYLVVELNYDHHVIVAAYATRENAKKDADARNLASSGQWDNDYDVEEYEVLP